MVTKAHVFIEGKVQGVFYRIWVRSKAKKLGLVGWVKNLTDGRVEAVFEGPKETIKEIIDSCWAGPSASKVEKVGVKWEKVSNRHESFEIRR